MVKKYYLCDNYIIMKEDPRNPLTMRGHKLKIAFGIFRFFALQKGKKSYNFLSIIFISYAFHTFKRMPTISLILLLL